MNTVTLSPRKLDLLDELDALRKKRGIYYRAGNISALEQVHQEMKQFWLRNGWSEEDAQADYLVHVDECKVPYADTIDELSIIKGRLLLLAHI